MTSSAAPAPAIVVTKAQAAVRLRRGRYSGERTKTVWRVTGIGVVVRDFSTRKDALRHAQAEAARTGRPIIEGWPKGGELR